MDNIILTNKQKQDILAILQEKSPFVSRTFISADMDMLTASFSYANRQSHDLTIWVDIDDIRVVYVPVFVSWADRTVNYKLERVISHSNL